MSDTCGVNVEVSQIVDFLPDPTFVIDRHGRVILWNKAMEILSGIPAPEMLGKGNYEHALPFFGSRRPLLADLILNPDLQRDIEAPHQCQYRNDGRLYLEGEFSFQRAQRKRCITAYASPIHDSSGNLIGAIQTLRDITERKQVEQALVESEEQFRLLFESSADGNLLMDDGRFIDCNEAALRVLGLPDKSMLIDKRPCHLSPRLQPDGVSSGKKARMKLESVLQNGSQRFEWVHRHFDGSEVHVDVMLMVIPTHGRKLIYATWRDITERKRVEQALMESEEKFRLLFESSADGSLLVDQGRIIDCNEAALEILGLPYKAMLINKQPHDLSPRFQPDGVLSSKKSRMKLEETFKNGPQRFEWVHQRFDGSEVHVEVMLMAIPMQGRQLIYATWRDITERKRSEEALCASEERFRTLFENATEGIFQSTPAGRFINVNPSLARMGGFSSTLEMIASVSDIAQDLYANPDDRLALLRMLAELDNIEGWEVAFRRKDGSRIWISMNIHIVRDEKKSLRYYEGTCTDITERKQTEDALRASEERYRTLFENATEGIFQSTPAGRFITVNPSLARMGGFSSPPEAVASVQDLAQDHYANPEDRRTLMRMLEEHGRVEGFEVEMLRRDGSRIDMSMNMHTVRDAQGNILYFDGTCIDITERKQAEERLKESEHRLAQFIDFLPDPTLAIDLDGRVLVWNKAMEDMTGIKAPDIIGQTNHAYAVPFYGRHTPILVDLCLHPDVEAEKQYAFIRKEENLLIAEARVMNNQRIIWGKASRIFNSRGDLIGAIETMRDITDRKKAEKRLRASEERYRLAADNIHDMISLYDMDLKYTYVSPSVERITGYTSHDMIGQSALAIIEDEESHQKLAAIHDQIRELVRNQDPFLQSRSWTVELKRIVKSGNPMWTESNINILLDDRGRPLGILCVTRDIDERKRAQEQMQFYQEHLQRSQKLEAIGTLAGGIAHDFNNILSVIIGFSELIRDDRSTGDKTREMIVEVLKAGERARDLVHQILTFSRQVEVEVQPLAVHLIVKEALKLLRATIPTTIAIVQDIDPATGSILADPTQIHQVVMNLCANAYQAMQNTGGTLSVSLEALALDGHAAYRHPDLKTGDYVKLSVQDTGCGMDETTLRRIFEPFFTTKEQGVGSGLGLAITHGIIRKLGGAIVVSSTPGTGSCFEVFLPRFGIDVYEDTAAAEAIPAGKGERVLLVDDEPDIVKFTAIMLEQLGYAVSAHTSSQEALETLRGDPHAFDLVISDQTMPGLRGDQLATAILGIRPGIPIVLMTGYSAVIDREGATQLGVKGFIDKPFSSTTMARSIRKALMNHGVA